MTDRAYTYQPIYEVVNCPHCCGVGILKSITNGIANPKDAWRYGIIDFLQYLHDKKGSWKHATYQIFSRWVRIKQFVTAQECIAFTNSFHKKHGRYAETDLCHVFGAIWHKGRVRELRDFIKNYDNELLYNGSGEQIVLYALSKIIQQRGEITNGYW